MVAHIYHSGDRAYIIDNVRGYSFESYERFMHHSVC